MHKASFVIQRFQLHVVFMAPEMPETLREDCYNRLGEERNKELGWCQGRTMIISEWLGKPEHGG